VCMSELVVWAVTGVRLTGKLCERSELTWDDHIKFSSLCNKVSKNIGNLRHILKINTCYIVEKLIFYAHQSVYFEYCNVIWAIYSSIAL